MPQPRWSANSIAFALSTGAKTAINLIPGAAPTDRISSITSIGVSIDTAANVLVELCESTQAGAGTTGTAPTLKQVGGFSGSDGASPANATAAGNYSVEPTVLTRLFAWRFTGPGPFVIQFPLGREPESLVSGATKYKGLALRLTASTGTPSCDSYLEFE